MLQANFNKAERKLQKMGLSMAFVYTTCVLFPETFIHKHEVSYPETNTGTGRYLHTVGTVQKGVRKIIYILLRYLPVTRATSNWKLINLNQFVFKK